MGSLCALDIVLLFGRRHAPPFFDGGGAERSREERCVDEEELSGYGVEEEQLCVCGTAFFRHWFESFCWRAFFVLCASSLFVCMFFHFLYIFFSHSNSQIARFHDSFFHSPHILSPALTVINYTQPPTLNFVLSRWAQATDQLVEDMYLLTMRSGGTG